MRKLILLRIGLNRIGDGFRSWPLQMGPGRAVTQSSRQCKIPLSWLSGRGVTAGVGRSSPPGDFIWFVAVLQPGPALVLGAVWAVVCGRTLLPSTPGSGGFFWMLLLVLQLPPDLAPLPGHPGPSTPHLPLGHWMEWVGRSPWRLARTPTGRAGQMG